CGELRRGGEHDTSVRLESGHLRGEGGLCRCIGAGGEREVHLEAGRGALDVCTGLGRRGSLAVRRSIAGALGRAARGRCRPLAAAGAGACAGTLALDLGVAVRLGLDLDGAAAMAGTLTGRRRLELACALAHAVTRPCALGLAFGVVHVRGALPGAAAPTGAFAGSGCFELTGAFAGSFACSATLELDL